MVSCSTLTNLSGSKKDQTIAELTKKNYIYCEALNPIFWSKSDTEDTLLQVKKHNALYKELCPQRQK